MFSRASLSRTSLKPQAPRPIEPSPTAMRMTLAAMPPYSKSFRFMATPFALLFMPASCPAGLGATPWSGRLELGADELRLEGSNGDGAASKELPYSDVNRFRLARSGEERLQGRPTLLLELRGGEMLKIAGVSQPGIVAELSDRLGVLTGDPKAVETAAIVVPLRPGSRAEVEKLLRNGPPFDPSKLGLVRHEVFVSEEEAIFVFQGLPSVFARRLADDSFWNAATEWRPLVRG